MLFVSDHKLHNIIFFLFKCSATKSENSTSNITTQNTLNNELTLTIYLVIAVTKGNYLVVSAVQRTTTAF